MQKTVLFAANFPVRGDVGSLFPGLSSYRASS